MTLRSIVSMLAALVLAVPLADAAPSPSVAGGAVFQTSGAGDAFERYVRNHAEWQNPDAFMRFLRNHPNGYASDRVHPDGFANVAAAVPRGGLADAGSSDVTGDTGWRELAFGVAIGIALGLVGALTITAVRGRRLAHS